MKFTVATHVFTVATHVFMMSRLLTALTLLSLTLLYSTTSLSCNDSVTVDIGYHKTKSSNRKAVYAPRTVTSCDETATNGTDDFAITWRGNQVIATRTDLNSGWWNGNVSVQCCLLPCGDGTKIAFGALKTEKSQYTKTVQTSLTVDTCPEKATNTSGDEFDVTWSGKSVTVTRTDLQSWWWNDSLAVTCCLLEEASACELSGWGECSVTCGGGTQHRSVLKAAENGGSCEATSQSCNNAKCPDPCDYVDCGNNGWCDAGTCLCTNSYSGPTCRTAPTDPCDGMNCGDNGWCSQGHCVCKGGYMGDHCEDAPAPVTRMDCKWKEWGQCSHSCGDGEQTREKEFVSVPSSTPEIATCDGSSTRKCNIAQCAPDARMECRWAPFGPCSHTCGGGVQTRAQTWISVSGSTDETSTCEGSSTRNCNDEECPVTPTVRMECRWSQWGTCTHTCGGGVQTRAQKWISVSGTTSETSTCEGSSTQNCNAEECPLAPTARMECRWDHWGPCSHECGEGVQTRAQNWISVTGSTLDVDLDPTCQGPSTRNCNNGECTKPDTSATEAGEEELSGDLPAKFKPSSLKGDDGSGLCDPQCEGKCGGDDDSCGSLCPNPCKLLGPNYMCVSGGGAQPCVENGGIKFTAATAFMLSAIMLLWQQL